MLSSFFTISLQFFYKFDNLLQIKTHYAIVKKKDYITIKETKERKEMIMKRTSKIMVTLLFIVAILFCQYQVVKAHSVELDPEGLITMPTVIVGGKGKITIKSTVTDYTLSYQAVKIADSVYAQMEAAKTTGKAELETLETEYTALKVENDNLKAIYDSATTAYQEGLNNDELDEIAKEELKTAYETAKTNYEAKHQEYNNKIDAYNAKVEEVNGKIKELTPTYADNNWKEATDNECIIDVEEFTGVQNYVIWAKLVVGDKTSYDAEVYKATGTKPEEIKVTGISLDKKTLSLEVGEMDTLTATITPTNATNKTVTWKSSNEDIATVENGKVTAKAEGTVTITVKTEDGEFTDTCEVTVSKKSPVDSDKDDDQKPADKEEDKKPSNGKDDTTVKGELPKTGFVNVMLIMAVVMLPLGIVCYRKYQHFNIK